MKKSIAFCVCFFAAVAMQGNAMVEKDSAEEIASDIAYPVTDVVINVGNVNCVGKETRTDQFESCDDFNPLPSTCNFDGKCVNSKCRDGEGDPTTETVVIINSGAGTKVPKWPADINVPHADKVRLTLDDYVSCYKKEECYCSDDGLQGPICHPGTETVYKLARLSKSNVKCPPKTNGDEPEVP